MSEINVGWHCTGLSGLPIKKLSNSIVIYGDQGPLKYLWSNHFNMGNLQMGGACVYMTMVRKPSVVRQDFVKYGFDISSHEKNGKFYFVDMYPYFGRQSEEKYKANVKESTLNHICIELTKALQECNTNLGLVTLDSISALMLYFKPDEVIRFVLEQSAKISDKEWSGLFIVDKGTTGEQEERMLKSVLNGVFEIDKAPEPNFAIFTAQWIKGILDKPLITVFDDAQLIGHNVCMAAAEKGKRTR